MFLKKLCLNNFIQFFYMSLLSFFLLNSQVLLAGDKVGDIVYSVLSESQFKTVHCGSATCDEWELLATKTLSDGTLKALTGWSTLPDARGRFLRMKDYRMGVDSSGDQVVGHLEGDLTKSPTTPFSTISNSTSSSGAHSHGISDPQHDHQAFTHVTGQGNVGGVTAERRRLASRANIFSDGGWENDIFGHTNKVSTNITINSSDNHNHNIPSLNITGGDSETRPKSMVVNVFIKVKETPECLLLPETYPTQIYNKYICLMDLYDRFHTGSLTLNEFQLMEFIRQLVRFRNVTLNALNATPNTFTQSQKDALNNLVAIDSILDKYPTYFKILK